MCRVDYSNRRKLSPIERELSVENVAKKDFIGEFKLISPGAQYL